MPQLLTFLYAYNYRWRIFRRPIIAQPRRAVVYAKAAIALHNYLRTTESSVYCPPGFVDGEDGEGNPIEGGWRKDDETCTNMQSISQTSSNRYNYTHATLLMLQLNFFPCRHSRSAAAIRDKFKNYFVSPAGEVQWQYAYVRRTF